MKNGKVFCFVFLVVAIMSKCLQVEIDPIKISHEVLGGVLVAMDILTYSPEEYPSDPKYPVCVIAVSHTSGLSWASRAYTKLYIAAEPSIKEEALILRDFADYLDVLGGGTLTAHYGALDEGDVFDLPYLLGRARAVHPSIYPKLAVSLGHFKRHDTCLYVRERMGLPSSELEYAESHYGLTRGADVILEDDMRAYMDRYWKIGDEKVLKHAITNVYNTLRIAQAQIRKSIRCADFLL